MQQLAAKWTRTIDQIAYENFSKKNFQVICSVRVPFKTLNKSLRRTSPAHCFVGGLKWTRTIDWKVKRFSAKISKAFDIVAVDVCHLSRNKTPYEVNLVCCFVGGLKWTRTIDWKVKRFSAKISKAFDIVAVDVCHLSRNKTPYEVNLVCCFVGGLKWTRTIDLTLIRRVL